MDVPVTVLYCSLLHRSGGIAGLLSWKAAWLWVSITQCVPWAPSEPAEPYLPCPEQCSLWSHAPAPKQEPSHPSGQKQR